MTIDATLTLAAAANESWEAIIVGAGPAGALAARELARHGKRVLLVDKRGFPRPKVCGACLGPHALGVLERVGLGTLPTQLGGAHYDRLGLWSRGAAADVPLLGGVALAHEPHWIRRSCKRRCGQASQFLPGTRAELGSLSVDCRHVRLHQLDQQQEATTQIVVAADGGGGNLMSQAPEVTYRVWKQSRIGAGAVWQDGGDFYQPGQIYMAVGRHGYAGLVRAENDLLNVAAALDVSYIRRCGDIAKAISATIEEAGLPALAADKASWRGTPPMTRVASQVGCERLFAIGDAAGYVEPFTGEGMAWAMSSAVLVVPHLLPAIQSWHETLTAAWTKSYRREIRSRQRECWRLAALLRRPWLVRNSIRALRRYPVLARPLVRRISSVPKEITA